MVQRWCWFEFPRDGLDVCGCESRCMDCFKGKVIASLPQVYSASICYEWFAKCRDVWREFNDIMNVGHLYDLVSNLALTLDSEGKSSHSSIL